MGQNAIWVSGVLLKSTLRDTSARIRICQIIPKRPISFESIWARMVLVCESVSTSGVSPSSRNKSVGSSLLCELVSKSGVSASMRDKSVASILFCESVSMAEVSPSLRDKSVGSLLFCYTIFMSGVSASLRVLCIRRWPAEKAIILTAYLDLSSRSLICAALSKKKKRTKDFTSCQHIDVVVIPFCSVHAICMQRECFWADIAC